MCDWFGMCERRMTVGGMQEAPARSVRTFNVQKYNMYDGPGVRSMAFFKGCPLRCKWCSNPESQESTPTLCYSEATCIRCHTCVASCPNHEIVAAEDGSWWTGFRFWGAVAYPDGIAAGDNL